MPDDSSQVQIPPSFVALFVPPGRSKPTASREHIAVRYEFCEDLAQMLTETTATQRWSLGITTADALARVQGHAIRGEVLELLDERGATLLRFQARR